MNKDKFLECLNIVNRNIEKASYDDLRYIKFFMYKNPNDKDVITFKNWLINIYQTPFLDQNLTNALSIPNTLKYQKIQEIYYYLPFMLSNNIYQTYFFSLVWTEQSKHFYDALFKFLKYEKKCLISDDIINKINDFVTENRIIQISSKDDYKSYNDELNIYKNLLLGKIPIEFIEFQKKELLNAKYSRKNLDDYEIFKNFQNKTLGNIGELYIFEKIIKNLKNPIFTAKVLGNGFGFDMYFQNNINYQIIENLIEVKSTANLNGDDYIELSLNEYNTLIKTLDNPNAKYYICRVFIDINQKDFEYYFLEFNENTLKSINYEHDALEYEMINNNKLIFKRKQKVMMLKK